MYYIMTQFLKKNAHNQTLNLHYDAFRRLGLRPGPQN